MTRNDKKKKEKTLFLRMRLIIVLLLLVAFCNLANIIIYLLIIFILEIYVNSSLTIKSHRGKHFAGGTFSLPRRCPVGRRHCEDPAESDKYIFSRVNSDILNEITYLDMCGRKHAFPYIYIN